MSNCRGEKASDIVPSISTAGRSLGRLFARKGALYHAHQLLCSVVLIPQAVGSTHFGSLQNFGIDKRGSHNDFDLRKSLFDTLCGGKTGVLVLRLHIHKDELYGGIAMLFRFKGVTENADKMKLAVCRKTIDKVLLDV